jgi:hypothetical protein
MLRLGFTRSGKREILLEIISGGGLHFLIFKEAAPTLTKFWNLFSVSKHSRVMSPNDYDLTVYTEWVDFFILARFTSIKPVPMVHRLFKSYSLFS